MRASPTLQTRAKTTRHAYRQYCKRLYNCVKPAARPRPTWRAWCTPPDQAISATTSRARTALASAIDSPAVSSPFLPLSHDRCPARTLAPIRTRSFRSGRIWKGARLAWPRTHACFFLRCAHPVRSGAARHTHSLCAGPRASIGIGVTGLSQRQRRCYAKHHQGQSQGLSKYPYHSFFSFSKEVIFLRCLASGLAPMPMGLCLLTSVGVQTICQRSRAAGVLVFHHVVQPMPDAVVGACEALGTRRVRGSRASRRAPLYYRRRSPHEPTTVTMWCHWANMSSAPRCAAHPRAGCPAPLDQRTPAV
jgi:hypothetical protein